MPSPVKISKFNISQLNRFIDAKSVAIPGFQRGYVWRVKQVKDLFDSLIKNYPVGSFIIWKTTKKIEGRTLNGEKLPAEKYLILDGQQRMSTLFYLCNQNKFIRNNVKTSFYENCEARQRSLIDFESFYFERNGKGQELKYLKSAAKEFNYKRFQRLLGNYAFPVVVVSMDDYHKAVEIFERINQSGTRIPTETIFLSETWNECCNFGKLIKRWKASHPDSLTRDVDTVIFIHLFAIIFQLEDKNEKKSSIEISVRALKKIAEVIRVNKVDIYEKKFKRGIEAISCAARFLREEYGIEKISDLPSQTMLTVLSVFFYYLQNGRPDNQQKKELKKWFWRSSLASRYIGSGYNENIGPDSRQMVALAIDRAELNLPKAKLYFSDFEKIDLNTGRSTLRNAVKQMLWLKSPVWIDGTPIARKDVDGKTHQKEDDHFYPYNSMEKGYIGAEINNILNLNFLSKDQNISKGKKMPSEWLQERMEKFGANEKKIKDFFERSLLPFESLSSLKRYDKGFIGKKGKITPEKFEKRYWRFLWKRSKWFLEEFDKLQDGI
jgi:hypothetical protein